MKIVLYQPEIPQNTGTIGRLCVATNTPLYLVRPLGFHLDEKAIRRSGLDYWQHLQYKLVDDLAEIKAENAKSRFWYLSTRGTTSYTDISYQNNDILVFGSEGSGLSEETYKQERDSLISIPQWGPVRSLNLATAVGITLYEAYRQIK